MVVNDDQASRVQENGTFKDFSRVDDRGAECAHCHMIHPDGHMFCIEKESIKMFAILVFADVFEVSVDVFRWLASSLGVERRCGLFDKTDGVARNVVDTGLVLIESSLQWRSSPCGEPVSASAR